MSLPGLCSQAGSVLCSAGLSLSKCPGPPCPSPGDPTVGSSWVPRLTGPSLSSPLTLARGSLAVFPGRGVVLGHFKLPGRRAAPPSASYHLQCGAWRPREKDGDPHLDLDRRTVSPINTSQFGREGRLG